MRRGDLRTENEKGRQWCRPFRVRPVTDGLAVAALGRREQVGALVRTAGDEGVDRLTALLRLHRSLDARVDGTGEDVVRVDVAASLAVAVAGLGGTDAKTERGGGGKKHGLHGLSPISPGLAMAVQITP